MRESRCFRNFDFRSLKSVEVSQQHMSTSDRLRGKSQFNLLTNPPEDDRSGGGAALGLGGEEEKLWQKRVEEKSRAEARLDFESFLGGPSSFFNSTRPAIRRPVVKCVDPLESRETKDGYFCTKFCSKMARKEQSITLVHFAQLPIFSMDPHFGRGGFRTHNH